MLQLNPYIGFDGKCREAMTFYKENLGGELTLQVIGESPIASQMPPHMKDSILHSMLISEGMVIMATDCSREKPVNGNTITLCLNCSIEEEIRRLFSGLSSGGKITEPLADMFWGGLYGGFTDKFGIQWVMNFDKNHKN